jgi:hypothetical protein
MVSNLFKINGRLLFFSLLIIFVIFSYSVKQKDDKKNIIELLTFLDTSFNRIDNTFNNLANQSLILENNEKNYDTIISELQSLSRDIGTYKFSIPNQTGEEQYQNVRVSLTELYGVSQEKTDLFISIFKARKDLIMSINSYYKIKNIEYVNTNQELFTITEAWKKTIDFKKIEAKQNDTKETVDYLNEKIKREEEVFQSVVEIGKKSSEILTPETKQQLSETLKNTQVIQYDGFLRLQIASLESPRFGEKLKILQDNVKQLKKVNSISSS